MYIGGRAYLEISPSARFYAWEKEGKTKAKNNNKSSPPNHPAEGNEGDNSMNNPNRPPLLPQVPASQSVPSSSLRMTSLICDDTG